MSIALFDIDHFKAINDTYGHTAGDEILTEVAAHMKSNIRESDILCRWGGEEFLLVMPEEHAFIVSEKIRKQIEKNYMNSRTAITISAGIAQFDVTINKLELIKRADQALYIAKNQGRNQCTCYNLIDPSSDVPVYHDNAGSDAKNEFEI